MANTPKEAILNQTSYASIHTSAVSVANGGYQKLDYPLNASRCESRPFGNLIFKLTFASQPAAANKTVDILKRFITLRGVGTEWEPVPDDENYPRVIAPIRLDGADLVSAATQYHMVENVRMPGPEDECEIWIRNKSGQTLNGLLVYLSTHSLIPYATP